MNEHTSKLLEELSHVVKNTEDFVIKEAPSVVQQLIRWEITSSVVYILVSAFAEMVFTYLLFLVPTIQDRGMRGPAYFFLGLATVIPVLFIVASVLDILKLWIAPKVYLLEYLENLLSDKE